MNLPRYTGRPVLPAFDAGKVLILLTFSVIPGVASNVVPILRFEVVEDAQ